jgi:hypothetical protein
MPWARYHFNGYECSSRGDIRFSALYAKLSDGRTLEEAYQLDVKGYRAVSNDWRDGKGNKAYNEKTRAELWAEYLELWEQFARENPELIDDLEALTRGKVLTDQFATSDINQAHALSVIIDRMRTNSKLPFEF